MKQEEEILKYILKNGSITTLEAMQNLCCLDLQRYIMLLRNKGYLIEDIWVKSTKGKRYKKYFIKERESK